MRGAPGRDSRISKFMHDGDALRVAVSAILMIIFVASGLWLWLSFLLAIAIYIGLALLAPAKGDEAERRHLPEKTGFSIPDLGDRMAYRSCQGLHLKLATLAPRITDPALSGSLNSINTRTENILDVIKEDDKYEASPLLKDLIGPTYEFLARYDLVVLRRGFIGEISIDEMRTTLAGRRDRFEQFWLTLNRSAIVDLKTLKEIIDLETALEGPSPSESEDAFDEDDYPQSDPDEKVDVEAIKTAASHVESTNLEACQPKGVCLTSREIEVACLITKGLSDKQIGVIMFIATRTVNKHVQNAMRKCNVQTRTALAVYVINYRICTVEEPLIGTP